MTAKTAQDLLDAGWVRFMLGGTEYWLHDEVADGHREAEALRMENERREAEQRVLAMRGSYDAPGFDACVKAELRDMENERQKGDEDATRG